MMVVMGFVKMEPQINADERRFIESDNYEKTCQGSEKICSGAGNRKGFVSDERRLNALSEGIIGAVFEIGNVSGADILNIRAGD